MHFLPVGCSDARTTEHRSLLSGVGLLCDGVDECIKATRYALREGADFIKVATTGGVASQKDKPSDVQFNLDEIKAIVETAAQSGKFVSAHCQNSAGAKQSILGGVKTIDHANDVDDAVVELALGKGAIFVSSLAVARAMLDRGTEGGMPPWAVEKAKKQWDLMCESYRRIKEAGAVLAVGTDHIGSPSMKLGRNAIELELLVKHCDFTPMEAIVAATKHGAAACFMEEETGTIEPGKLADILIVDGDPLADIGILQELERIKMVMLEGRVEIDRR
jgi:imidazolonepropionase-like amidohydrolase